MAQFDGRPGALPITAYYKGDFALQFSFTSGGSAYSLVGASATFVIYERNGTAALSLSSGSGLTINEAGGSITLGITNAQIVALATQEYNYEFILTLTGGNVWPVLDSVFNVSENGQASYSGDTVTVALDGNSISLTILPAAGDVGSGGGVNDGDTLTTGLTFPNTGLHILDTNATHDLIVTPGSNLTADRTLTVTTGDADRTLTLSGDTTLSGGTHSGTNTGDQTITLSGDVSGSGTGAITATISAIDAAKIADGTVSNAEFQYLNGVTSGVQGQIDGKAATSHTHAIGDVTGLQTALDGKVDENAAITGATKTKITYDAKGLVTAGADATTADIADSLNKRYITDAQQTVLGNTSGTNTGDQDLSGLQPIDATLTALAGLTIAADTLTIGTGADAFSQTAFAANTFPAKASTGNLVAKTITDFGLSLVDDATASDARTTLGLGTLATQSGTFSGTSSGTNTGDQTITLTGDVTGSGTGTFSATIANSAVSLAKMADMATDSFLGRDTAGTGVPEVLSASTAKTIMSLNNVENTALSTWAGTTNITTVGTVGTGTWGGTAIAVDKGGTGLTSYTAGDIITATGTTTLGKIALGTASQQIRVNAGGTALEYFTPSAGAGDIVNGGNTTGSTVVIGTNDAQSLELETSGTTFMAANSSGNVGIGSSPGSMRLSVAITDVSTSGTPIGVQTRVTLSPGSNSSASPRSLNMANYLDAAGINFTGSSSCGWFENRAINVGDVTNLYGVHTTGLIMGSDATTIGTVSNVAGVRVLPINSFSNAVSGTVSIARGIAIENSNKGSLTVTSQVGLNCVALSAATNNTAVLLGTSSIPSGNFGIYSTVTDDSYLAGKLGLGVTGPTAVLHLKAGTATANTGPMKFTSGTNLTTAEAGVMEYDGTELYFSPSTTRQKLVRSLNGSGTLDFGSTAAGTSVDLTITVTGAADGDPVLLGVPNGSTLSNGCFTAWVSATNTVTVRFSNNSLVSALDPASGTFKVTVQK